MPGSWRQSDHPLLTPATYKITSRTSRQYNCIAWAAEIDTDWWWPDSRGIGKWPPNVPRTITMDAFVQAYATLGYQLCYDNSLQAGVQKIAIFGKINPVDGSNIPTHAALQLESGEWTSKMGPLEDISHTAVGDVAGPFYGRVMYYMSRPRRAS